MHPLKLKGEKFSFFFYLIYCEYYVFLIVINIVFLRNSEQDIYYYQNKTKLLNATHLYKVQKSGVSPLNFFHLNIQIPVALNTKNDGAQKILSIFQPIGVQGDQSFFCTWDEPYNTIEEKMDTMEDIGTMRSKRSTLTNPTVTTKKSNDTSKMYIVPLSNKVAFLNCSSADVVCKNIACEIGPFKNALKVASLQIKMVLNMTMLESTFYHHHYLLPFANTTFFFFYRICLEEKQTKYYLFINGWSCERNWWPSVSQIKVIFCLTPIFFLPLFNKVSIN